MQAAVVKVRNSGGEPSPPFRPCRRRQRTRLPVPPRRRIAPEVLLGGRQCTQAVDIYSFGGETAPVPAKGPLRGSCGMHGRHAVVSALALTYPAPLTPTPTPPHSSVVLWEIVTGLRPQRGNIRMPKVPEECPQASGCSWCLQRAGPVVQGAESVWAVRLPAAR